MRNAWALLLVVSLLSVGCGGDGPEDDGADEGLGPERAGSIARLAQCSDWREWAEDERIAAIEDVREQLNQSGNLEPQPDLSNESAYAVFERMCSRPYAIGFRLYRVYSRAGAFSSLAPPDE